MSLGSQKHSQIYTAALVGTGWDETENLQSPLSAAIEDLQVLEEIKAFLI